MKVALQVFDALRTFDRPATRAELERETGLAPDQVKFALRALVRHAVLVVQVEPRQRGLYALIPGATRPTSRMRAPSPRDDAGRYVRGPELQRAVGANARARIAAGDNWSTAYSPARPPSHQAAPGAARLVVTGVLDIKHQRGGDFGVPFLSRVWRKRGV